MATRHLDYTAPEIAYRSPCGRIEIIRYDARDFGMVVDGNYIGARPTQRQAEYDAHAVLVETLQAEAVDNADYDAERAQDEVEREQQRYSGYSWN